MNLLVNASHAIEGVGTIFIKTRSNDGSVIVEIRDTGMGIPTENLTRIFDPGFTTKGFGVGTGLGLSIVYQVLHQGTVVDRLPVSPQLMILPGLPGGCLSSRHV